MEKTMNGQAVTDERILANMKKVGQCSDEFRVVQLNQYIQQDNGEFLEQGMKSYIISEYFVKTAVTALHLPSQQVVELLGANEEVLADSHELSIDTLPWQPPSSIYTLEEFEAFEKKKAESELTQIIQEPFVKNYILSSGRNSDDFRIVQLAEYRDVMNDGVMVYQGQRPHVIQATLANEATSIQYDFTHTGIQLGNAKGEPLGEATVGLGYDDITAPTAFSVEDLAFQLKA